MGNDAERDRSILFPREITRELEAMSVRVKVARCGNARRDWISRPLVKTAGESEVRLKYIHASTLCGFGFLIDRGLGYFRQGLVGCFFLI